MHQTRAWLFAFKRAFQHYAPPPPQEDEALLDLLREADQCHGESEGEGSAPERNGPPAGKPVRH